jgi:hypothetical protein
MASTPKPMAHPSKIALASGGAFLGAPVRKPRREDVDVWGRGESTVGSSSTRLVRGAGGAGEVAGVVAGGVSLARRGGAAGAMARPGGVRDAAVRRPLGACTGAGGAGGSSAGRSLARMGATRSRQATSQK